MCYSWVVLARRVSFVFFAFCRMGGDPRDGTDVSPVTRSGLAGDGGRKNGSFLCTEFGLTEIYSNS